jgi:hypothetical protein
MVNYPIRSTVMSYELDPWALNEDWSASPTRSGRTESPFVLAARENMLRLGTHGKLEPTVAANGLGAMGSGGKGRVGSISAKRLLAVVMLAISVLCAPPFAAAATTPPVKLTYEQTIAGCEKQITQWNREANWQEVFIICVIVFGGAITVCHALRLRWAKTVALILGAASSILTGINAKNFNADYHTLRRAAARGEIVVNKLDAIVSVINEAHLTDQALSQLDAQFMKEVEDFDAIITDVSGTSEESSEAESASIFSVPRVLAQSGTTAITPTWVTQRPSSSSSLYYVGKGTDASLENAQKSSLSNALDQALTDASKQIPDSTTEKLQSLINGSYAVRDTSLQYNPQTRAYTYYTLISVSNLIFSLGRPTPVTYQQSGWLPVDLTAFGSTVVVLDSSGGVSSIERDSEGSTINLLFRIQAALRAVAVTADSNYIYATANSLLGCTVVRYSIAAQKTDQRLIEAQRRCAGIASDGSTLYVVMPDDRAIVYVRSWTGNIGSWEVSTASTLNALVYDPFGQRLVTADANGAAYGISTSSGSVQLLSEGLGYVTELAVSTQYLMASSGKKVLFISRSDNIGANPPSSFGSLPGGALIGIAVDQAGGVWVADSDKRLVEGPFFLN